MTRIEFWSAVMGLLVAVVVMFNQANGRVDRLQSETNRRFQALEVRFDQVFDRLDRMQETIMSFDRRVRALQSVSMPKVSKPRCPSALLAFQRTP